MPHFGCMAACDTRNVSNTTIETVCLVPGDMVGGSHTAYLGMSVSRRYYMFLYGILLTSISIGLHQAVSEQFTFCFIQNVISKYDQETLSVIASEDDHANTTLINTTGLHHIHITSEDGFLLTNHTPVARLHGTAKENKGMRIITEGNTPIVCVDRTRHFSGDMFTPFPDDQLGTDHVALTYCHGDAHCIIAVVGVTEGTTNVTIVFPSTFEGVLDFDGHTYKAGDTLHLTLFNLQTFQLLSHASLSGVIVTSNNKVGVFVGADRTNIVNDVSYNHLVESLPPIHSWGKQYILVRRGSDMVQILSSANNTDVNITSCDKNQNSVIDAIDDVLEFQMECPYCHITASYRILVVQLIKSTNNGKNPSLYFPTPVTSYSNAYAVAPPPSYETPCQVGLVAKTSDLADIASQFTTQSVSWINVSSTGFAVTTIELHSNETIIVRSKNETFGGHLSCQLRFYITASTRLAPYSSDVQFPPVTTQQTQTMATVGEADSTHAVPLSTHTVPISTEGETVSTHTVPVSTEEETVSTHTVPVSTEGEAVSTHTVPVSTQAVTENCSCTSCKLQSTPKNLTVEDLKSIVQELKSKLYVKKTATSAWKRKLNSATDARPSSQGIGLFAAFLLICVFGSVVLVDITSFLSGCKRGHTKGRKQVQPEA